MAVLNQQKRWLVVEETDPSPLTMGQIVERQAKASFQRSPYAEIHRIRCEFHEGILTLRGSVSSYYLKQIAQTVARDVDGVERVNNRVDVYRPPDYA